MQEAEKIPIQINPMIATRKPIVIKHVCVFLNKENILKTGGKLDLYELTFRGKVV